MNLIENNAWFSQSRESITFNFVDERALIENFKKLETNIKLLIIGGNDIDGLYCEKIKSLKNQNIINLDPVLA